METATVYVIIIYMVIDEFYYLLWSLAYICYFRYDYGLYNACETLSNRWISGDELPTDNHDFNQFSTGQKIEFLSTLLLKVTQWIVFFILCFVAMNLQ